MIKKLKSSRACKKDSCHYKDLVLDCGITLYLRGPNEIQFQISYDDSDRPFVRFEIDKGDFKKMMDWFNSPQQREYPDPPPLPPGVEVLTCSTQSIFK